MEPTLRQESPFPPQHAFVVQFHKETALEQWHVAGRIEHVVSGQATHFHSLEELMAFMARALSSVRTPPRRRVKKFE